LFVKGKQFPLFGHNIYKGFLNIHEDINGKAADIYNSGTGADSLWKPSIIYLKNAVKALQDKGTIVVFISAPEKKESERRRTGFRKTADSVFTSISNEYHIKYLHFENETTYKDEYFVDDIHLNEPGTKIYSKQLADSIIRIIADK
jgi:hypothetical protein